MTINKEEAGRLPPRVLINKLHRIYGNRPIQRDPFGRRAALASEIERALACAGGASVAAPEPDVGGKRWCR
ncbi:MAG: hypothetical protein J7575_07370 [Chloroflexi bacterium]|jgi:hypothetical protein|nr:hypothetical protein [Chloroflexota bacterium]